MILLSFIIPAYNVEKYLDRCLNSLIDKNCIGRYEVIIINDGSTDNTEKIALNFVEKYPEIFSYRYKENGGHGSVINLGVELVEGKYIKVLDSDDWIITENLLKLIDFLSNSDVDAIFTDYGEVDMKSGNITPKNVKFSQAYQPIEFKKFMRFYRKTHKKLTFHSVIYKLNTYKCGNIKLTEKVFYEDQEYITLPFINVKLVAFLPFNFYQYLVGNDNQSVSVANQVKNIGNIEIVLDKIIAFFIENSMNMSKAQRNFFKLRISYVAVSYIFTALMKNTNRKIALNQAKGVYKKSKKYANGIYINKKYFYLRFLYEIKLDYEKLLKFKIY